MSGSVGIGGGAQYATLFITSSACGLKCEKRYPLDLTLDQFKEKLVLVTGCDNRNMKIEMFDDKQTSLGFLIDGAQTLCSLGVSSGYHLHVSDHTLQLGAFDSVADTQEDFVLPYEKYAERDDSVLAWKRRNKLGQFREVDPEEAKKEAEKLKQIIDEEKAKADVIHAGDRCETRIPKQAARRGVVQFVGQTKFKSGYWIGIRYDEPLGKNDGSVGGIKYFECPDKYGAFVKPQYVHVGDYPELSIDELDEL